MKLYEFKAANFWDVEKLSKYIVFNDNVCNNRVEESTKDFNKTICHLLHKFYFKAVSAIELNGDSSEHIVKDSELVDELLNEIKPDEHPDTTRLMIQNKGLSHVSLREHKDFYLDTAVSAYKPKLYKFTYWDFKTGLDNTEYGIMSGEHEPLVHFITYVLRLHKDSIDKLIADDYNFSQQTGGMKDKLKEMSELIDLLIDDVQECDNLDSVIQDITFNNIGMELEVY